MVERERVSTTLKLGSLKACVYTRGSLHVHIGLKGSISGEARVSFCSDCLGLLLLVAIMVGPISADLDHLFEMGVSRGQQFGLSTPTAKHYLAVSKQGSLIEGSTADSGA